jgi:leader peptidase (prepilin peptidase)/N-methyltransferase
LFFVIGGGLGAGFWEMGWVLRRDETGPGGGAGALLGAGLGGGLVAIALSWLVRPLVWAALLLPFVVLMTTIAAIDARTKIIPNRLVYPALAGYAVAIPVIDAIDGRLSVAHAAIGLAAYGGGLLVLHLIAPSAMGMGDVKLAALIGLVIGAVRLTAVWTAALAGVFAGGVGAVVALTLLRMSRSQSIPYGPFLAAGGILAALLVTRLG